MQEKQFYLGEGDDKVLLAFNLNVVKEIQEVWGSLDKWTKLLQPPKGEPDLDAFIRGFAFMLNEGIDIENEDRKPEEQKRPLTDKQVGRLISKWGKDEVSTAMRSAIVGSVDTGKDSKNESSTSKQTVA